jgi:hypothetical protein
MGLLAEIYSTLDSAKRKAGAAAAGLIDDPAEQLRQWVANNNNDAGQRLKLLESLYLDKAGAPTLNPNAWTPQAAAAQNTLANDAMGAVMGATVWHGTPHTFDKFDSSKIGTGEGAQAYGHGLYFAESPAVAKSYQALAGPEVHIKGKPIARVPGSNEDAAAAWIEDAYGRGAEPFGDALAMLKRANPPDAPQIAAEIKRLAEQGAYLKKNPGSLYKVDLPDEHIGKMLDWDKPITQQPEHVQNALRSMVNDVTTGGADLSRASRDVTRAFNPYSRDELLADAAKRHGFTVKDGTLIKADGTVIPESAIQSQLQQKQRGKVYENAGQLYGDLAQINGSDAGVSAVLRNNGIPGVRYLDGGSRATGGTSNYVVFPGNEDILKILERNGMPLPPLIGPGR